MRYCYLTLKLNRITKETSDSDECVILGNGPSLKESFEKDMSFIKARKIFCVNSFAESDYYVDLKPNFYILADPLYWEKDYQNIFDDIENSNISKYEKNHDNIVNVEFYRKLKKVRDNLFKSLIDKTQWKLNLFIPLHSKPSGVFDEVAKKNKNINLIYYSTIPINFNIPFFRHLFYKLNIGMPTPQTVLVAAIFLALKSNFKKIFLFGVDHSWHEDLVLDENNILCIKDKHFYNATENKLTPLVGNIKTGITTKMHEQFYALYLTFRSHLLLEYYSEVINSKVYNFSKKTYVDAYERYYGN